MNEALIAAFAAIIAAVIAIVPALWVLRQTHKLREEQSSTDQRKLDQQAFDRFMTRYERERTDLEKQIRHQNRLLRVAVDYIGLLKSVMIRHRIDPPAIPAALSEIPWSAFEEDVEPVSPPSTGDPTA